MTRSQATLELPWQVPKLSPNVRMHWAARGRITAYVREQTGWIAKAAKLTPTHPFTVTLHYRPARNGRRDPGNLCLDCKASIDGLVDAGLAPDDTPEYIHETIPVIHAAEKGKPGALWLEISWEDS
jgi:crossover junction endodeoxyribonuclease RusA